MFINLVRATLVFAAVSGAAFAHGLSPTRIEAPSGSTLVAYRFSASNGPEANIYEIECFKGGFDTPYPCQFSPQVLILSRNATRNFKVQIQTNGDGLYLICTTQGITSEKFIVTRICARVGVGVPASTKPDSHRLYKPAISAPVPPRPRSN
jgi:hypothetical protein